MSLATLLYGPDAEESPPAGGKPAVRVVFWISVAF